LYIQHKIPTIVEKVSVKNEDPEVTQSESV